MEVLMPSDQIKYGLVNRYSSTITGWWFEISEKYESQLGWWHSQYIQKTCSKPPTRSSCPAAPRVRTSPATNQPTNGNLGHLWYSYFAKTATNQMLRPTSHMQLSFVNDVLLSVSTAFFVMLESPEFESMGNLNRFRWCSPFCHQPISKSSFLAAELTHCLPCPDHPWNMNPYIETPFLWPSFVGKYTSTMDHLGCGAPRHVPMVWGI